MQQDSPPLCQEQRSQAALAAWEVVIDLRGVTVLPKGMRTVPSSIGLVETMLGWYRGQFNVEDGDTCGY